MKRFSEPGFLLRFVDIKGGGIAWHGVGMVCCCCVASRFQ